MKSKRTAMALVALFLFALITTSSVSAQTFTVLYTFVGYPTDGAGPGAGLLMDASGNLYGTTAEGGALNGGTVFDGGYHLKLHAERAQRPLEAVGALEAVDQAGGFFEKDEFCDTFGADVGRQYNLVGAGLQ